MRVTVGRDAMSFNSSFEHVMKGESTSHVWIHFHRLVEA